MLHTLINTRLVALGRCCVASLLLCAGCASGLDCEDGEFLLDGEEFNDCKQCDDEASCYFETTATYGYSNGVRHVTSEVVTAHCDGETATIDNGVCR